jgi:hypothetical protein
MPRPPRARRANAGRDAPVTGGVSDRFMFSDRHVDRTPDRLARELGPGFARRLFELEPAAAWQGPIESGYGWHLVWMDSLEPGGISRTSRNSNPK